MQIKRLLSKITIEVLEEVDANKMPMQVVPSNAEMIGYRLNVTFKGKKLRNIWYVVKNGDYPNGIEPVWVVNSLFSNAFMYKVYKDDKFRFLEHVGQAYRGEASKALNLHEQLEHGYEETKKFFGEDFDLYYKTFLPLKDLPKIVFERMAVDEIADYLNQRRSDN